MKSYSKLQNEIREVELKMEDAKKGIKEADTRIGEGRRQEKELQPQLSEAVFAGDEPGTKKIEQKLDSIEKQRRRDAAYVTGANAFLMRTEKQLQEKRKELEEVFSSLAEAWLNKEKSKYDEMAKGLQMEIARLNACFHFLKDRGNSSLYAETVGAGFDFVLRAKIPVLQGFDKSKFMANYAVNPVPSILEGVKREILSGEK